MRSPLLSPVCVARHCIALRREPSRRTERREGSMCESSLSSARLSSARCVDGLEEDPNIVISPLFHSLLPASFPSSFPSSLPSSSSFQLPQFEVALDPVRNTRTMRLQADHLRLVQVRNNTPSRCVVYSRYNMWILVIDDRLECYVLNLTLTPFLLH